MSGLDNLEEWRCFHDIENFIERLTEQFIGVLCYWCHDETSKTKVLEPSQNLNGWVLFTDEATNPDFSFAKDRTTISCIFVPSKVTQEESWLNLSNSTWMERVLVPRRKFIHHALHAGLIAGGKDIKEGRQTVCFTALDPTGDEIGRHHDKYLTKTSGTLLWTPSVGSLWEKHKIRSHALILHDSVPADCIEKVVSTREESKASCSATSFQNCVGECLASAARQKFTATIRYRGIVCRTAKSIQHRYPSAMSTTECSTWRSRTNDQDSKLGAYSQNSVQNGVNDHWFTEHRWIEHVQWGVQKGHPKFGKDRIIRVVWSFYEDTLPILCQVLARRTVTLHQRKMFKAFEGAKTKDEGRIWRIVNTLLRCEQESFSRSKTFEFSRKTRTFQSEWINAAREEECWIVPKISDRHRMDRRTLQVFGLAYAHGFLKYSYAKRAAIWQQLYSWH